MMNRLYLLICCAGLALQSFAAPADRARQRACASAHALIDATERRALAAQSLDDLNVAAREEVARELELTERQRQRFDPLYDAYRKALRAAVDAAAASAQSDAEQEQRRALKAKLANIAAAAEVKRDYVDRFAEVLTAEQIRRFYNIEGRIGTEIKRAAAGKEAASLTLRGPGREATRDLGPAGDYAGLECGNQFSIEVSSAVRTVVVTGDERLIDYVTMERSGGVLRFGLAVRSLHVRNVRGYSGIRVVVPASSSLCSLKAGTRSSIVCRTPLRGETVSVAVSSYGSVKADIEATGAAKIEIDPYASFRGRATCGTCDLRAASYATIACPVVCRGEARATAASYAELSGGIEAPDAAVTVQSGATLRGALACERLRLDLYSYASYTGTIAAGRARLTLQSGATLGATFAGDVLTASVGSYGELALRGAAQVVEARVKVGSGASFRARELQVRDYDIDVAAFASADIWCSGRLKVSASQQAEVRYGGPCVVEALSDNIRRR